MRRLLLSAPLLFTPGLSHNRFDTWLNYYIFISSPLSFNSLPRCADACTYSFNIAENAFASVQLRNIAILLNALGQGALATRATTIASQVEAGLTAYGTMVHPTLGKVSYCMYLITIALSSYLSSSVEV